MGASRRRQILANLSWRWVAFAVLAAFPVIYLGLDLAWSAWTFLIVLVWGTCIVGIGVELDRRCR